MPASSQPSLFEQHRFHRAEPTAPAKLIEPAAEAPSEPRIRPHGSVFAALVLGAFGVLLGLVPSTDSLAVVAGAAAALLGLTGPARRPAAGTGVATASTGLGLLAMLLGVMSGHVF